MQEKSEFRVGKTGTVFKAATGKLYIFEGKTVSVLSHPWPTPSAWQKTFRNSLWMNFRPEISIPRGHLGAAIQRLELPAEENGQLVLPFFFNALDRQARRKKLTWLRWFELIPSEIRGLISPFPERHWHLLSFLARCGSPAADLAIANPALTFMLASNWIFHKPPVQRPLRAARALLRGKQRDFLGWLGFPPTEAVRKLLRRILHKAVTVQALLYLRQGLRDDRTVKLLALVTTRLNAGALRIATDPSLHRLVTPNLLEEVAHSHEEDHQTPAAWVLRDSHAMFELLFPARRFPVVGRLKALRELHDSLVTDLNRVGLKEIGLPFPPPPFNGSSSGDIDPITSSRELVEEGRLQHNCVSAYAKQVITGRLYIYRFRSPDERCTLSIMRRKSRWVLGELKATANKPASEETWQAVREWFKEASGEASIQNEPQDRHDFWR